MSTENQREGESQKKIVKVIDVVPVTLTMKNKYLTKSATNRTTEFVDPERVNLDKVAFERDIILVFSACRVSLLCCLRFISSS